MQVQQHLVLRQYWTQPVGHVVFELLRIVRGREPAVEIAFTLTSPMRIGEWVSHRHEGSLATHQPQRARVDLGR